MLSSVRVFSTIETDHLKLQALQRLIKQGPFDQASDSSSLPDPTKSEFSSKEMVELKWKELGAMSPLEAKKEFLSTLISLAPYWKWEQFVK